MAVYDVSSLGTDTFRLYFNDFTKQFDTDNVIFRVKNRAPQQWQIRDLDIPLPFESGISDFQTLLGKTAYVIEGTMYPGGESDSDLGLSKLRKVASLDLNQADVLSDDGYIPYVWTEFVRNKQVFMKPLYVQIVESTRQGLVLDFRIVAKIKDPTIYEETLREADTSQADFGASTGTALYSFTYPIIFGASTSTVSTDATNYGDLPAYPIAIAIHGPINTPRITNTSTGEYIEVASNLATSGNTLAISYDKDSLRVELDGVSVISQVSATSTYWKLQPGDNVISLSGSSVGTGAYATLTYHSAWPLG